MKVTQICIGRFHHFHLARQLEKRGLLEKIYTGYPRFKLKDEQDIPSKKINTFPLLQAPYMARGKFGLDKWKWLDNIWVWESTNQLDKYVTKKISTPGILFSLSGTGIYSGKKMQQLRGYHICDRGSSHISFQDEILSEEYKLWGLKWKGIYSKVINRGILEYEQADYITIPSEFVKQTFIEKGIKEEKLIKIPYGARLDRFSKIGNPDPNKFTVLWVGSISIRKGFLYALTAFNNFRHPNKEFIVIGSMTKEIEQLIQTKSLNNVIFKGIIPNDELPKFYSTAHVFILPSIEEGLAMVQGEALACGCPVIATPNSGSEDLFTNNKEGFIVPIRNSNRILEIFQKLNDEPDLRTQMGFNGIQRIKSIGGWDTYGNNMANFLVSLNNK